MFHVVHAHLQNSSWETSGIIFCSCPDRCIAILPSLCCCAQQTFYSLRRILVPREVQCRIPLCNNTQITGGIILMRRLSDRKHSPPKTRAQIPVIVRGAYQGIRYSLTSARNESKTLSNRMSSTSSTHLRNTCKPTEKWVCHPRSLKFINSSHE